MHDKSTKASFPFRKETTLAEQVGVKAMRKLNARRSTNHVFSGLGMMGLIGWSVVIPTLLGTGVGLWLDTQFSGQHSWTLALLVAGLFLGCLNAWLWVAKEDKAIREQQGDDDA